MRILICDDAGFVREILSRALFDLGYEVVGEARDGMEVVAQAAELQPDVIFLDLVLPLKNGAEAAKEIQDVARSASLVLLSSLDPEFVEKTAQVLGAKAVLTKPFTKADLKKVMVKLKIHLREVQGG